VDGVPRGVVAAVLSGGVGHQHRRAGERIDDGWCRERAGDRQVEPGTLFVGEQLGERIGWHGVVAEHAGGCADPWCGTLVPDQPAGVAELAVCGGDRVA
jgi:hypothetical protein